ncbi:MAG: hypothetical protein K8W52_21820 [Deltaproteobacteria bacterium]|nr:hypothetical protein [Deltaproteobacteria bacterium]
MKIHALIIAGLTGALLTLTATRAHAVPEQLGLTARVVDAGVPIAGAHTFTIRLFDVVSGGAQRWTESDAATADNGLVYLTLGDQAPLDAAILDGGPLWVELQVDQTVLSPRLPITSAPYAIRAGVAEDAERLGGQAASAFATATHNHAGVYLPVGSALACSSTQKVTGLDGSTGSVVCGPDVDTNTTYTAGAGLVLAGTQFAVNLTGGTCAPGTKVSAVSATGAVTCTADIDTSTAYTAGAGLSLNGTQFAASFAGTGAASTVAHSDHTHPGQCPTGFVTYLYGATTMCIRAFAVPITWYTAVRQCLVDGGQNLCRHEQIVRVRYANSGYAVKGDYWLGDKVDNNMASYTDNAPGTQITQDDIDGTAQVTDTRTGYYCCLERTWF